VMPSYVNGQDLCVVKFCAPSLAKYSYKDAIVPPRA
jgi:hypothetical protein